MCGSDAIMFDTEHGTMNEGQIENLVRLCEMAGITALCRVAAARPEFILRIMDAGVMGIIVPHVKTRQEVEEIVSAVKYPPIGRRGVGNFTRATGYGSLSVMKYLPKANKETMVTIQIEDPEGVENVEAIVKTEGLDCVFIGRNDLAVSMGYPGQQDAPEVQGAIDKVVTATLDAGLILQVVTSEEEAPYWIKRGARLLSMGWVSMLTNGLKGTFDRLRSSEVV